MLEDNKFQLYFAGTGGKPSLQKIRDLSCNQLLSQLNDRKAILGWVEYFKEHPECKTKLFVDSGAFSAHTKGKAIDVDEYINFMNEIDDYVHIFAQVDKIPGNFGQERTIEQLKEAPEQSWNNYLYMKEKVKSVDKLIPVFHQGEDFKWLKNMLEYKHANGNHIAYIGISPSNDVSVVQKTRWLLEVFKMIRNSSNPNVKTHAFGMTSLNLLEQFPFTSADSTSWIMTGANGNILTKFGTFAVSERTKTKSENIHNQAPSIIKSMDEYLNKFGTSVEEITNDQDARTCYHVAYLQDWCNNYKFRGTGLYVKSLI